MEDDALSYTSTEFETENILRPPDNVPFTQDALMKLNLNDPTTLLRLQEYYREQRRLLEQEKNHRVMLENKLKLITNERAYDRKKAESLNADKLTLEQNRLDLEAKIRHLNYRIGIEEEMRHNAEVLLEKFKEQLNRKEDKYTSSVNEKQKAEQEKQNLIVELRTAHNMVKQLADERDDLEQQLESEKEAQILQEQTYEEQQEKFQVVSQLLSEKTVAVQREDCGPEQEIKLDEALKAELHALQSELERQRSKSQDENALIVAHNEDLLNKIDELKNEIKLNEEALNQATMQYSVQVSQLNTNFLKVAADLDQERAANEKLETELESHKSRLQTTTASIEEALKARTELEREIQLLKETWRKEMQEKVDELEKWKEQNQEFIDKLAILDSRLESQDTELNAANTSLMERSNQLKQLQCDMDRKQAAHDYLDQNYKLEKELNTKLKAKIEILQEKLTTAQHESLNLKQQQDAVRQAALQDASADAQKKFNIILANLKTENEKALEKLEEKNMLLTETCTRLREEMNNVENRRCTLENDIKQLNHEYNELSKKLSHADASIEMEQKMREHMDEERSKLRGDLEKMQEKYEASQQKSMEAQSRILELVERLDRAEQNSILSNQQLVNTSANIQAFSKCKDEVESTNQKMQVETARLEAELKFERQHVEMLQQDLQDSQKVRNSLEVLCSNLKSTNSHLENKLGEEEATRSAYQQEAEDSKGLWEQEVVSRSKLGLRMAQLDREKQSINGTLEDEKRKTRKAVEAKKLLESKLESERQKYLHLQKEVTTLRVSLKNAKKKMKECGMHDSIAMSLSQEFEKERLETDRSLTAARDQLHQLQMEMADESEEKNRLLSEVYHLRTVHTLNNTPSNNTPSNNTPSNTVNNIGLYVDDTGQVAVKVSDSGGSTDVDGIRAELEAKYRLELNRKLSEVNCYLEDQARARDTMEISRTESEAKLISDKRRLEEEIMDLRLKYEKAVAKCETREIEARRLKELYDSETKWRMRLSDQLQNMQSTAGNYKSKLALERMHCNRLVNLNLTAASSLVGSSMNASHLSTTQDDALSNKLKTELDRSIARHLEAAPHDNVVTIVSSGDLAQVEASMSKSSADYHDILNRKYCL